MLYHELIATRIKMVYDGEIYEDFGTVSSTQLYYRKELVDSAIAQLLDELENACMERDDNQRAIDEWAQENENLKAYIKTLESPLSGNTSAPDRIANPQESPRYKSTDRTAGTSKNGTKDQISP